MAPTNMNNFIHNAEWSELYYFPCRPKKTGTNALEIYFQNLKAGAVFAYNDSSPKLLVLEFLKLKNNTSILVMCEREGFTCEMEGFKPWVIVKITFEHGIFVHSKLGSYFDKDDAIMEYIKANKWITDAGKPSIFVDIENNFEKE